MILKADYVFILRSIVILVLYQEHDLIWMYMFEPPLAKNIFKLLSEDD